LCGIFPFGWVGGLLRQHKQARIFMCTTGCSAQHLSNQQGQRMLPAWHRTFIFPPLPKDHLTTRFMGKDANQELNFRWHAWINLWDIIFRHDINLLYKHSNSSDRYFMFIHIKGKLTVTLCRGRASGNMGSFCTHLKWPSGYQTILDGIVSMIFYY